MDRDDDIGEPESSESGGDDSSSQSSKVSGEKDEVYVVETILAERKRRGVVEYLTAWKGWGEHYHTWEIEDNFNQDTTFTDWRNKRMRITRGFEPPFDVKAWKKRHDEYWLARYAKDDEKTRRNKQVDEPNPEESRGDEEKKDEDMHESDNSVHGFDSESAIKTPVEVIKTRNVHQDLPQSSPTRHSSSPSSRSSSSFEDDDHPQLSRQSPLANTCKPKWTHEETIALMKSLQALESPQWDKFCDLYGPKGTMSDALKDKSLEDVQEKVRSTRQEFVKSGREPPLYLNIVLPDTNNVYIRRASSKGKSKSSAQSRASSQERRRSSSRDSMMEELRAAKLRKDELKNAPNAPPITNSTKKLPLPEATPTSTRMNNPPIKTQKTDEARGKLISKIVTSVPPSEVPQLEDVRRVEKSARTEPSRGHWAGTAKTIMDPPASNAARMGAIGRGPARPNPLKIKQMAKSHDTRRKAADTTMIDVAANWNAAPKARKRKTLPTTNAASATGQTHKPFGNMAIRNAVRKSRLEHVPDPNRLVFIDPKTGKTPKALSSLSATKTLVEWPVTPFQKYQEELAAKETEAQAVKKPESYEESEDTLMVDATEPTISMQPPEKEPQASVGKATRTKANSLSPSNDADDDKDNALPNLEAQSHSYSLRPPMFRPDHPSGVPTGPKISATGTNTIALRDYIDRSLTNNSPGTNSTTTGLNQSLSGEKLSGFRLLDHPSREEEAWLFKIRDENVIIGDIKIETSGQANIRVKFLGLSHEVRQLVFSIKILPRTMNFEFEKVCKAYEYHSYFPAVSYISCSLPIADTV